MTRLKTLSHAAFLALAVTLHAATETSNLAPVIAKPMSRTMDLPGELQPFLSVLLHARVPGYVESILVDRGSAIKQGQLLVELSAPEMKARIAEVQARVEAAESDRLQAEAQLAAAQSTADRLKKASQTAGAVAGNELILAEKQVDAARAILDSRAEAKRSSEAALEAQQELVAYLKITAPFDAVVAERFVHPGALVGPSADQPLLDIRQISHLRLVVAVPEEDAGAVPEGAAVSFEVPAFPGRGYSGVIARSAHALDQKTRTMPVELDVFNRDGSLSPGMYATVQWPIRRSGKSLFVPKSSVVTTTERTFVIRDRGGRAEWVDVIKGAGEGDLVEVRGQLQPGDRVVRRGTDEIREGSVLADTAPPK